MIKNFKHSTYNIVLCRFTVKEEKLGGLGQCKPRAVSIYLKYGSIPYVNPDGSKVAAKVLNERRRHYGLNVSSDNDEHILNINAPNPGDWFVAAFRSWSDPNNGKITQQGLEKNCFV